MADRALMARPNDQQVAQNSGEQSHGGLSDFASSVWAKTKEVAQAAKPYGEKALDAAKDAAHAAKPYGEKALDGAKDAAGKAQKFGKDSGLTEDVTAIGKGTANEYKRDGMRVVEDAKKGNYVGAVLGGVKLGAKAHLAPLEIVGEKVPELADRQAGRHLSREQQAQVHSATDLARTGAKIGKVVSGGPSGVADAALDQAKKSATKTALEHPEVIQQGASTAADKAKSLFYGMKQRLSGDHSAPAEQSKH